MSSRLRQTQYSTPKHNVVESSWANAILDVQSG